MSGQAEGGALVDDARARRNTLVLSISQALYGSNATILITLGSLSGFYLAEDKALATLPVSALVMGSALTTIPASLFMRRYDRRTGFLLGIGCGIIGAGLCLLSLMIHSFWLFAAGMMACGVYQAFAQYYRFAAADTASDEFRPKSISWVMAGGAAAAVIGPQLVIWTRDLLAPIPFAGAYVAAAGAGLAAMLVILFVNIPPFTAEERAESGRPLPEIMRQPVFLVAAACGMVSFGLMTLVMTATPLAMVACSLTVDDAAFVIQWHALAMFLPSFFTGTLISRFGTTRIIMTGLALLAGCGAVAMSGVEIEKFWAALVLLGLGWNFGFVGATSLLTEAYTPVERNKVQAANDFLVFAAVALASVASGGLLHFQGWEAVNVTVFPFVLFALGLLGWLVLHRRSLAGAA